ncbi:Jag N-terminal domain-containing protein [Nitratifractor salsuginis]|uniref:RNA-binding protein KhpB N-terminal domain-containing protein n=1 Tax=Nitratifractor salsuginis (strain DSM 16511 / JCM 12458 / E9I37-1) TaxID=749222 RepID=E6WYW7_NITSE|nr:Jag N-terminal domain-containing protein [Nitratifractor salsuginis]ADV46553.1 hypothetical protein Nitsa_1302 [Nitratifractor salsuginis DSM 16511]
MKKIEAPTLEAAYRIACDTFGCSMTELKYEIVQYPSKGFLGLFSKPAIIVAMAEPRASEAAPYTEPSVVPEKQESKAAREEPVSVKEEEAPSAVEEAVEEVEETEEEANSSEEILDRFFSEESAGSAQEAGSETEKSEEALAREIEETIRDMMEQSCFDIDTVEVDVMEGTAYIFLDGEDAALLIGKEGYRYNALSYLLYNWIHSSYGLFVKLEVAQFLSTQQEMIRHHIQPVIEHVRQEGWGRTRPLDGILVQIALEQLREEFPDKYVAIKRQRDGGRYVLINEFNSRRK